MARYGGVIFDCDGVLLDSNRLKAQAFREVLAGHPAEAVAAFSAYQQAHPGQSRRLLFDQFFRHMVEHPDAEAAIEAAVAEFGRRTLAMLAACPAVPGAIETVRRLHAQGHPCAVVSAADAGDLRVLMDGRGIAGCFVAIRGGDRPKVDHMADLLGAGELARPLLYFGDSRVDMEAAEAFGARFVMVAGASEWEDGRTICRARGHAVVEDLREPWREAP